MKQKKKFVFVLCLLANKADFTFLSRAANTFFQTLYKNRYILTQNESPGHSNDVLMIRMTFAFAAQASNSHVSEFNAIQIFFLAFANLGKKKKRCYANLPIKCICCFHSVLTFTLFTAAIILPLFTYNPNCCVLSLSLYLIQCL